LLGVALVVIAIRLTATAAEALTTTGITIAAATATAAAMTTSAATTKTTAAAMAPAAMTATAETTATAGFVVLLSLFYRNNAAFEKGHIEVVNCIVRMELICHLHKAKTLWHSRCRIDDDLYRSYFTKLREQRS